MLTSRDKGLEYRLERVLVKLEIGNSVEGD